MTHDSSVNHRAMHEPQRLQIILESMSNYDRLVIDQPAQLVPHVSQIVRHMFEFRLFNA